MKNKKFFGALIAAALLFLAEVILRRIPVKRRDAWQTPL